MDGSRFAWAAMDAGLGMRVSMLGSAPEVLGAQVVDRAKRLARFVQKSHPDIRRTHAHEVVARAVGFANWHTLQSTAQRLIEDFDTEKHWPRDPSARSRSAVMAGAVGLFIELDDGVAPDDAGTKCLLSLAEKLAKASGKEVDSMLDVLAKLSGADTWRVLCTRDPVEAEGPLYAFRVTEEGGEFLASAAAGRIVSALEDRLPDEAASRAERDAAVREVSALTAKRPDHIEAHRIRADLLADDEDVQRQQSAGAAYLAGIEQGERLIPQDFRGEISWYWTTNRCYLRLLYGRMRWCTSHGKMAEAERLAWKQLALCQSDNCGVRFELAPILMATGNMKGAAEASRHLGDGADADLIRAMVFFAQGDRKAAKHSLLKALFSFPMVRGIVLGDPALADPQDTRGVIPDAPTMYGQYHTAMRVDGMVEAMTKWVRSREVVKAEATLKTMWESFWRRDGLQMDEREARFDEWDRERERLAAALSQRA